MRPLTTLKMSGHGGGCCHEHKHEHEHEGDLYTLYSKIDLNRLECLNESIDGSAKHIFKPHHDRLSSDKVLLLSLSSQL